MGFVAFAFVVSTRPFNAAGSVYACNGTALGPGYGFVSAWLLLLVYPSFAAGVYAATADIAQTLLASFGLHVGWVWLGLAGAALALALAYTSIGVSSLVIIAPDGAAVAVIPIVSLAPLAARAVPQHQVNRPPLRPHRGPLP